MLRRRASSHPDRVQQEVQLLARIVVQLAGSGRSRGHTLQAGRPLALEVDDGIDVGLLGEPRQLGAR